MSTPEIFILGLAALSVIFGVSLAQRG